jgi:hypothetical protein
VAATSTAPLLRGEGFFGPATKVLQEITQQLDALEATVSGFAQSFTSAHITTQELCVSDQSGAQTCITKEQLDALLAAPSSGSQDSINSGVQTSGHSKGVNRFFYKTLGPELGQTTLRDTQQGALR